MYIWSISRAVTGLFQAVFPPNCVQPVSQIDLNPSAAATAIRTSLPARLSPGTLPPGIEKNLKTISEAANLFLAEPMNKEQRVGRLGRNAMWTLTFIPITCTDPAAALDFFEYVNSRAGCDLCVAGISGVTMTEDGVVKDRLFVPITEGCAKEWGDPQAISPL